jgi:hypothetical protein
MAYVATIKMNSGESFTATGISIVEGRLEFTGTTVLTGRTNCGLRVDSATAGAAMLGDIQSITVA